MEARTQRTMRMLVGLATLAAVVFGLLKIVDILNRSSQADRFKLYVLFKDAQGLAPGSLVRYRGMVVGKVASLELDVTERVRVELSLDPAGARLARSTTQFWIVRPRMGSVAGELSGLDTLIKESYLRVRQRSDGAALASGDELFGVERPPDDLNADELEDPEPGDLLATVVVADKFGLRPGNAVLFRGVETGEVRNVRLAEDGRGVLVQIRVRRAFRETVRERSRFWVSRPILRGSLISGATVDDLGSILKSAMVYDSHTAQGSEHAADNAVFIALTEPPGDTEDWAGSTVSTKVNGDTARNLSGASGKIEPFVDVRYRAIEVDTFGDDDVRASGRGVLYRSRRGALCVLVSRSACDGNYFIADHWYDTRRIKDERILVELSDGRIWPARRVWQAPGQRDLAILVLQPPEGAGDLRLPAWRKYLAFDAQPAAGSDKKPLDLLEDGRRVVGVLGKGPADAPAAGPVGFRDVPETFRPEGA